MQTRISKWGNSLALRLPKEIVDGAHLAEGIEVDVAVAGDRVVVRRVVPKPTLEQLLAAYTPGTEPDPEDVDFGPPAGREVW